MKLWPFAPLLLLLTGCGSGSNGSDSGVPPVDCPTHDQATFELGTGETGFEPLADGDALPIISGPQGGCHFWFSVRTDGFAQRRFLVRYEVKFTESGTTTGSRSRFTVRLRPDETSPGICQYTGLTAFLIEPWRFAGDRVTLEVEVTDDEGRTASAARDVVADWPEELPDEACGPRS